MSLDPDSWKSPAPDPINPDSQIAKRSMGTVKKQQVFIFEKPYSDKKKSQWTRMIMFVVYSRLLFLSEEDVISFDDAAQRDQNQKMFPKRYRFLYLMFMKMVI